MRTQRASALLLTLGLAVGATEGATVDDLLAAYRGEGAGPFSAASGERLWDQQHPGAEGPRTCADCHTKDPRNPGRHTVTGKDIDPLAPSANPKRLTDKREVEKWLGRNCKWTLGRYCTAQEKGDLLTFLQSQ
jgi:hypothetical protein